MEIKRQKYQGVLNILNFNRHYYYIGISALILIAGTIYFLNWNNPFLWLIIVAFLYGLIMPLLVSAYVYDFSGFYDFKWLKDMQLKDDDRQLNLNINAGFDETSYNIKHILPHSKLQVYDFYNEKEHTEPAIVRARKKSITYPGTKKIESNKIPLKNNTVANVFLISAVHEIRDHEERIAFLKECKRVCIPGGKIIIVEHLRDMPNFFAFSVGFTHFFSKKIWRWCLEKAGFKTISEKKFTPFMSIFECQY